ncbi:hypothetical protein GGI07_001503 [Coemansia sp. Benny D115]|nr:hypothetical protein GGI07_001503 [Coemansia sp. Benny D115]
MRMASWLLLPLPLPLLAKPALKSVTIAALAFLSIVGTSPYATVAASDAPSCGPSSRYVVAYYQTWKRQSLMNIDWSKISHVNVAHGIPTDSGDFVFDGEWFLPQLIRDARKEQTKVSVSIGGWTGSNRFSAIMRDTHKRAALIRSIGVFVEKHELDGVDIDWEYVGRQGSKCNKFSVTDDAANFLRFLRALRASFHARFPDSEKLISLAVRVQPFENSDGPMTDVSPFAEYVDFASILAFDINGSWSNTTGPNAPFEHQRNRGSPYSFVQSIEQWLGAKWPAEKLVAGVSFSGRSLTTRDVITAKDGASMYVPFDKDIPQGDAEDARWYDVCENTNSMSGVWQYKHLRDQGILKTTNSTGDEWVRMWDEKSSTPWLYNPQMRRFISYDDPESVTKKVEFVKTKNLKGMMAWALHADHNNELTDTLNRVGPLCRGPRSDSDEPKQSSSTADSNTSTSHWSPTPPFAFHPSTTSTMSASAASTSSGSGSGSGSTSNSNNNSDSAAKSEQAGSSTSPAATTSVASSSSLSSSAESATNDHLSSDSVQSSSESVSAESASSSASSTTGKVIMFDNVGAPYMMIDGTSTPIPSELAEKIMKVAEKTPSSSGNSASATGVTATGDLNGDTLASALTSPTDAASTSVTDDALPLGPIAIPVVDSATASNDKLNMHAQLSPALHPGPNRPLWTRESGLFDTINASSTKLSSQGLSDYAHDVHSTQLPLSLATPGGFAATFYLTLDPNSAQSASGQVSSTTVIPFAQMMESARNGAASPTHDNTLLSSDTSPQTPSLSASASASAATDASSASF